VNGTTKLIKEISNVKFYYTVCYINEFFDPCASFLKLRCNVGEDETQEAPYISGKDIFNLNLNLFCRTAKDKTLECEQFDKFDHIYNELQPSELVHSHSKSEFFISAVKVLFSKLCEEVVLSACKKGLRKMKRLMSK